MQISTGSARRRFITTAMIAATLLGALAGPAHAVDITIHKTGNFLWSWSSSNNIQYGSNRTKGSGVVKDASRPVEKFSRLMLALPATVTIVQGPTESLNISTDDNLLPLISTRVENDELIIEADKNRGFSTKEGIKIRLTVKSLNGIKISGSGDVIGDQLQSDKLDILIAGSGDVKFKSIRAEQFNIGIKGSGDLAIDALTSKSVDASIHGSGDIKLPSLQAAQVNISVNGSGDVFAAGNVEKVDIEIMGSGDVRTRKLIAREARVKIMASGDAEVYAKEKLTATVTGSGDIRYAGSPSNISKTVRGSGSVEAM